jgi:hypothetical protein
MDRIFKKSEFIGKMPLAGVLKDGKDIIYFTTSQIHYLDNEEAESNCLEKSEIKDGNKNKVNASS